MKTRTTYSVVKKINGRRVAIDAGVGSTIEIGQRVHLVRLGDEVIHPDTREKLGRLEQLLATGFVAHIQDQMSIVTDQDPHSPPNRTLRSSLGDLSQAMIDSTYRLPFEDVGEGDVAVVYT